MYKRLLLKLSGEALKDNDSSILSGKTIKEFAKVIKNLHDNGFEICVVIGAGNIWRGKIAEEVGLDRVPADFMGMMGTIINAVALSNALKNIDVPTLVTSALPEIPEIDTNYSPELAIKAMEEGKVVFLAGGTGKPYFSTDTAATMRAIETNCDVILVGKNGVEGIYSADPNKDPNAKFIKTITFDEILNLNLQIMDISAIELIKDKNIQIRIFSMSNPENFLKVANGEDIGSVCKRKE